MYAPNKCPWCGCTDLDFAEVDIGVGMQQVSPAVCMGCLAVQIGPYDEESRSDDEEKERGFYRPEEQCPIDTTK